jgi:hypothetical protein
MLDARKRFVFGNKGRKYSLHFQLQMPEVPKAEGKRAA